MWFVQGDRRGQWIQMERNLSEALENALSARMDILSYVWRDLYIYNDGAQKANYCAYEIDLEAMTQTNKQTQTVRQLLRVPNVLSSHHGGEVKWLVKVDRRDVWQELDEETKTACEEKLLKQENTHECFWRKFRYEINISELTQTNMNTKKKRSLIRVFK